MRVAFLSDVHANMPAFEAALARAKRWGADDVVLLGDVVNMGPHPKEVVAACRKRRIESVAGNHDLLVTGQEGVPRRLREAKPEVADALERNARWTAQELSATDLAWLKALPRTRRLRLGGRIVVLAHASPDSAWDGIAPDAPDALLAAHLDAARADVLVVGHTHASMTRELPDGRLVLNPGSVGASGEGPEAALLLADFGAGAFEVARVAYDVEEYKRDSLKAGVGLS